MITETPSREEMFRVALTILANYIETTFPSVSAQDMINNYGRQQAIKMMPRLNDSQIWTVKEMRRLAKAVSDGEILILEKHQ